MSKEVEITDWFARQSEAGSSGFPIGIGDDMAQMNLGGGRSVLITTDMLLDGVHFDLTTASLEQVGYKAMATNLSDCAAMATMPLCAVCSVAVPRTFEAGALKELHAGITRAGAMFDCHLIGGDITSWDSPFAVSIAMLSRAVGPAVVKRTGAKIGDAICVTGSLGGSLRGRHLNFVPRVHEAIKLANLVDLHAMMDLSDGLSTDLNHICRLSNVGALIEAAAVPVSEDAKKSDDPLGAALNDGEDFELLFTLSQADYEFLRANWDEPLAVTKVGTVTEGQAQIISGDGIESILLPRGYDHLRK